MPPPKLHWFFFLALALFYLSLSPGTMSGMGYTAENMKAADQIITNLGDWAALRPAATQITWPRHGLFELIFEIPFLLLSRLLFGHSPVQADFFLAFQPILMTALLCTLIFVWVQRLTASLVWAYLLALVAGLATMLWPYAYIGLETTQSLFLLLAGYLALSPEQKRTWPRALLFAIAGGVAVSVKSNGIFLAPAVASLVYFYVRGELTNQNLRSIRAWVKPIAIVLVIGALYQFNAYTRSLSPTWGSGAVAFLKTYIAGDPLIIAFNVLSLFVSLNKGLLMYAPVVLLSLIAFRQACRINPRVAIFAGLTLAGLVGGCALVYFWADETWGPRYLHAAIAPLMICLAVTKQSVRFRFWRELPLLILALGGLAVSFLGAFYYYGLLHGAAMRSSVSTFEGLQHDITLNHVRFNLKLLQVWRRGGQSSDIAEPWPPPRHWWFAPPPDAVLPKTIDLREYARPQPLLTRTRGSLPPEHKVTWYLYLICLWLGPLLLIGLAVLVVSGERRWRRTEPQPVRSSEELSSSAKISRPRQD